MPSSAKRCGAPAKTGSSSSTRSTRSPARGRRGGPDVSREGVQRDILPIVEGSTVNTKHGPIKTDHVLFIAAGAFHISKPSDMIPELQGRFPIRVELDSLTAEDFKTILTQPKNALVEQYKALLAGRWRHARIPRRCNRAARRLRDARQRADREHRRAAPAHRTRARPRRCQLQRSRDRPAGRDRSVLRPRRGSPTWSRTPTSLGTFFNVDSHYGPEGAGRENEANLHHEQVDRRSSALRYGWHACRAATVNNNGIIGADSDTSRDCGGSRPISIEVLYPITRTRTARLRKPRSTLRPKARSAEQQLQLLLIAVAAELPRIRPAGSALAQSQIPTPHAKPALEPNVLRNAIAGPSGPPRHRADQQAVTF